MMPSVLFRVSWMILQRIIKAQHAHYVMPNKTLYQQTMVVRWMVRMRQLIDQPCATLRNAVGVVVSVVDQLLTGFADVGAPVAVHRDVRLECVMFLE